MPDLSASSPSAADSGPRKDDSRDIEATRMSFGDHLEELRSRLIKALVGVVLCATLSLVFARHLLSFLLQPALVVLRSHGQPTSLLVLGPSDAFTIYLKIGFLVGLIVAMPWVLYQLWLFVATGLYRNERGFVKRFMPVSILLFLAGVLFMYFIALPIAMNFFVKFSLGYPMPGLTPTKLQSWLLGTEAPATQPVTPAAEVSLPLLPGRPNEVKPGSVWVDTAMNRLNVQTDRGILSVPMEIAGNQTPVSSQFGLNFYVSFVLAMALAFGLTFEVPVLVVFLVLMRIVSADMITRSRGYILFGSVVLAAVMTPPDVLSLFLLWIPMLALFEGGLLVARMVDKQRGSEDEGTQHLS